MHNLYVIYYGWLISDPSGVPSTEAAAIAAMRPRALIGFYHTFEPVMDNYSSQVRAMLHAADVQLFTYIDTDYGNRPLEEVIVETKMYLSKEIDGIFFDQVYNFLDDHHTAYYQTLYNLVHANNTPVIVNTGVGQCGESIMSVTDILMVEHDWRALYQLNPWFTRYSPERFMGNSSNEPNTDRYFDAPINVESAVRDTQEAWANGIGWHYSTDQYITLPDWFLAYASRVNTCRWQAPRPQASMCTRRPMLKRSSNS